ncbi:MAG: hypothetical protein JWM53_3708 [bacterium]|nr:hypothetical protein [bacterium]
MVTVIVTLAFSAAVLAIVRDARRLRGAIAQLERRVVTLELDSAATLVIEPESDPPLPRRASQLLN